MAMLILELAVCSVQCAGQIFSFLWELSNVEYSAQGSVCSFHYEVCSEQCNIQFSMNILSGKY